MKFLLSLTISLITSVILLYYLLNNPTFLPFDTLGNYDWINIFTLILLLLVCLLSAFSLLIYFLLLSFKKYQNRKDLILSTFKYASVFTLGLFMATILNYFHILDIAWGIAISIVVLISLFII
jgi:hypothetical protein